MTGFDVLATVGAKRMPMVIFVTAHDRFALQAFEAEAVDYLLKPFGAERVQKALAACAGIPGRRAPQAGTPIRQAAARHVGRA